jgi:tetratricopeptide (TPR) repeat protein
MKYIFFALIIFLFSCNDKQKESAPETAATPVSNTTPNEQSLIDAVQQHPDSLILFENLLQYYSDAGNADKALAAINKAQATDSLNPRLWDIKSAFYLQKDDTLRAINSLEKAISIFPEPSYIISLGALYAQTKNAHALEMADALLAGNKAAAEKEAYFIKGLYYSFNNEKEKSIPFFDKSIAISYTFTEAYLEKGIALYDLGKYQASADILEKSVMVQNNFDRGYYFLGRTYEKLNRKEDAANAYRSALLYDPQYDEANAALSRLGL